MSYIDSAVAIGSYAYQAYPYVKRWTKYLHENDNRRNHWRFKKMPPISRSASRGRSRTRTPAPKRRRVISMPATPARSRSHGGAFGRASSSKRSGARASRSRGKVSFGNSQGLTGSNAKVFTSRLVRKTKQRKISKRGILFKQKVGGTTNSANTTFLGHATAPYQVLLENMYLALAKELMLHAKADVGDVTEVLPLTSFDSIVVLYQPREAAVASIETMVLAPTDTIKSIGLWLADNSRPWGDEASNGPTSDQFIWHSIRYVPSASGLAQNLNLCPSFLSLKMAKISFSGSSTLKMQNRTVNLVSEEDAEADDVDNVPLLCVAYEGPGTGVTYIKPPSVGVANPSFVANADTGVIGTEDGTATGSPSFLPDPTQFNKVTKTSKFDYEPGQIRVSKLSWSRNIGWNQAHQMLHPHGTGVTFTVMKPLGAYRMFGFEKKIHFAETDTNIQSVYEVEYDLAVGLKFGRTYQSTTVFKTQYDTNL